jgi:hypothetical protein
MNNTSYKDQFQQLREFNRAFLALLKARAEAQHTCFGLPLGVRPLLRSASAPLLDAAAEFPRALFRLRLDSRLPAAIDEDRLPAVLDDSEHDLGLSILFAVRHTCRQSGYQARLLFALESADVQRLVVMGLPELQRLAAVPALLQCAFADRQWFWQGLLTATRPESRRQLTLMALQPAAVPAWPQRRPPHPAS